jgi:hypothetical protein
MSWAVCRLRAPWLAGGFIGATLDVVLCYPNVLGLVLGRVFLASAILLGPPTLVTNAWLIVALALLSGLFILRTPYGHDGADQLTWIIISGLAIVSIAPTVAVMTTYLWFVALQSCLAYGTAGIAKACAKGWRDGSYLVGILATRTYGHARFANVLRDRRQLAKWVSCMLILWECLFPLVLIAPTALFPAIIGAGVLFHVLNGLIMGLNTFLWSFIATYPAIYFCVRTRGW